MRRFGFLTAALLLAACADGPERMTDLARPAQPGLPDALQSTASSVMAQPPSGGTGGINPIVTEAGNISLSVDALGTVAALGTIQVDKPAGATVRNAFLFSATTPTGRVIVDGEVSLEGSGVHWDGHQQGDFLGAVYNNYYADVTAIVKPVIDAAAPGLVDLNVIEAGSGTIDGEILAVIFNDPNQTSDNTVVLLFGAQKSTGDVFFVSFADPLDTSDPDLIIDMSLGIGYGFQGTSQFSLVDVDGQRLTSSAGGQDDGVGINGALMTAGGIGDSNGNPPPLAPPSGPRTDDELYNLVPFATDGATSLQIDTRNPSNDDNILFAAFFMTVEGQIVTDPSENAAPTADAGPDQTLECSDGCASTVLDGSASSDPDGDDLSYSWTDADGNEIATGVNPTIELPLGVHALTLTVSDGVLDATDEIVVTVLDTTPPDVSLVMLTTELWPPNHKMHLVASGVTATDACDDDLVVVVDVTSNEPTNGLGDGDTEPDWDVVDNGDGTFDVFVRAERSGTGTGREYTVTVTAIDGSGNVASESALVTVRHDKGKGKGKGKSE